MPILKHVHLFILLIAFSATYSYAEIEKVANPRAYVAIDDKKIGTREDGLGVENGHKVADIVLAEHYGGSISLTDLWAGHPLIVIFYRGGWCPFCNAQIKEMADNSERFEEIGVLPVFISVDTPDAVSLTNQTYQIPFPVLSDTNLKAHTEFNVINKISDELQERAASRGLDFSEWSGSDHGVIAHASSFLVDTNGVVQWSTVVKDYRSRPSIDQLIAAIEQWQEKQGEGSE